MQLQAVNSLNESQAISELQRCCGSLRWATEMARSRPFATLNAAFEKADQIWWSLERTDWLEAFSHHPKIGDVSDLRKKFATTADWSKGEQGGVSAAAEKTLQELASGNDAYERKFGYIFIVCATGKTADEMLELLKTRLKNDPAQEIRIAAAEQSKITRIRLEKLCQEAQSQPTC